MGLDELSVEVAGTPVRTYRAGTGPALVLLHGGGLDDARLTWAPVWDRLTAHVQVVAPDLPGYGGSPLGPTPATLEGYRTWLLEFLDACDLGQATLAGLSLGGGIALRTVLDEPTRVRALTLIAPYGVSSRLPGGRTGYFSVHTPGATAITDTMLRHSDRLLRASLQALLYRPDAVTQELITEVRALLTRPDAGAAWSAFQHHEVEWTGPRTYFGEQLGAIACPAPAAVGCTRPAGTTRRCSRRGRSHPWRPVRARRRRRSLATSRRPRPGRRAATRVPAPSRRSPSTLVPRSLVNGSSVRAVPRLA